MKRGSLTSIDWKEPLFRPPPTHASLEALVCGAVHAFAPGTGLFGESHALVPPNCAALRGTHSPQLTSSKHTPTDPRSWQEPTAHNNTAPPQAPNNPQLSPRAVEIIPKMISPGL
jgi:hypothetical protein